MARNVVTVLVLLVLAPSVRVHAQPHVPASIEEIKVGFASVPSPEASGDEVARDTLFKAGCWVPVQVRIRGASSGKIHVETTDADDTPTIYTVSFQDDGRGADEPRQIVGYTKLGSITSEIKVSLETNGTVVSSARTFIAVPSDDSLCLSLGTKLDGLNRVLMKARNPETSAPGLTNCRLAWTDEAEKLPNRWFGYGSVDLVILDTSNREFLRALLRDDRPYRVTLADWVRRGGHVVISCGRNPDALTEIATALQMPVPFTAAGRLPTRSLDSLRSWTSGLHGFPTSGDVFEGGVRLQRKGVEPIEWLLPAREDAQTFPLVVRWPFGCGQVTFVAIDLDAAPFTSWAGESDFWKVLLLRCGIRRPANPAGGARATSADRAVTDLTTQLQRQLDEFPQVGAVSFGWVAVLLLALIIAVGPLDYLFLKKLTNRLGWTWFTFPAIAILVSVAAWLSARSLKGDTQRINKVDLVDIDLLGKRTYGTTWFTVFSPRSDSYTIALEPTAPTWASKPTAGMASSVVLSWLGRPEASFGGYDRPRSQPLFGRAYHFAPDASALMQVPIPVWASKTFTASWEGEFPLDPAPSRLYRRPSASGLNGVFVNPLHVTLHDAVLIHGESETQIRVYQLGTLVPKQNKPLAAVPETQLSQWLAQADAQAPHFALMRRIMFYDASAHADGARNRAQTQLDQSWRRSLSNEVMLVARIPRHEGPAQQVTDDPATPSRLRLGRETVDGRAPSPLEGAIVQDTFVRIFVPIEPARRTQP